MLRIALLLPLILALAFMLACSSESSKDDVGERPTATTRAVPAKAMTTEESIRQENLNYEYSHGIVVDDSMSDELLNALFFLQLYLDLPARRDVAPDDLGKWCLRGVNPMTYYSAAPDRDKAPIVMEHWASMDRHIFTCIDDPEYKSKHMLVGLYFDAHGWLEGINVAPDILFVLYRLRLVSQVQEYRYTLSDITNECFDAYYGESSSALRKCYATRLISDIPFMEGYQYDRVRSLME